MSVEQRKSAIRKGYVREKVKRRRGFPKRGAGSLFLWEGADYFLDTFGKFLVQSSCPAEVLRKSFLHFSLPKVS